MSNKEFWVVKLPSNNKLLKNTQCKYNSKNQLQQTGGLIKELVELCQNTKVIRDQNSQPLSELSRGGGSDSQEPLAAAVAVETRRPTGPRIYAFHFNQAGQERLSCRRVKEKGGWETTAVVVIKEVEVDTVVKVEVMMVMAMVVTEMAVVDTKVEEIVEAVVVIEMAVDTVVEVMVMVMVMDTMVVVVTKVVTELKEIVEAVVITKVKEIV
ncbi:hypothetical protein Bca4012_007597 [Brassica carinata]